jgi:cyclic pyranopterin phosphate synthase
MLTDALSRSLRDLRLSVTDRCNFRCSYCMPKEVYGRDFAFLERAELLTFEELARLARIFATLGTQKIRLTGGEPLLRRNLERLVAMLAAIDGIEDVALTTNGSLLTPARARSLADAGLRRVTVSLDSLDDATFRAMNDVNFPVARVLEAIEAAVAAGLTPVKVDVVVKRGVNDAGVVDLARRFRNTSCVLRFIEYMDVGSTNGWRLDDVVAGAEVVARISQEWPLVAVPPNYPGEVAQRWRYADGSGEVGVITSVTQPFCGACTRARLSANGELYTCLFASRGRDLRALLRNGADDATLARAVADTWRVREDRYSEIRTLATSREPKVEMSRIGG